jgi:hypothetical protein
MKTMPNWCKYGSRLGAIALIGLSAGFSRADARPDDPENAAEKSELQPEAGGVLVIATPQGADEVAAEGRMPMPDYWLGLDGSPISPAMRSQLKLDGEGGLVVERLIEDGPAAKCGIKQYDILLMAGDAELRELADLVKLLNQGKDQEIEFQILRGGEKQSVKVKPEKRPEPKAAQNPGPAEGHGKAIEILREQLSKARTPMRMQFFHPGIMLPPGAVAAPIPDDVRLHIDKQGSKPARIVVERGDDRWETTEDKLDKLPEDVRPHVEALLGRMPMPKFDVMIDSAAAAPLNVPLPPALNERLEKRLDNLSRRMEKMAEQLDEIRGDRNGNE